MAQQGPDVTPLGEALRAALRRDSAEVEARAHCAPEPEYLWTIWFEGTSGTQKADITCTREAAGKVWDTLASVMSRMLSARP